jgi:hypothetical protein
MGRLTDTTPEAERVLRESIRRLPFERRWRQMADMYHTARLLHAAGARHRRPDATEEEIAEEWRARGAAPAPVPPRKAAMPFPDENIAVVQEVIATLTRLGVPYALGGSWASCLFGKMRFTQHADLTAEPFPGREEAFCSAFGPDYYVSLSAVQDAVRRRASFNVIHTTTGFKVDVFVRKDRPFEASLMRRRQAHAVAPGQEVVCVTPEDVILLKLEWYRLGPSERQWNDVLGVLEVQGDRLDDAYLDRWAADLGVADLLARARQEAAL